ncbi:DUF2239 family protein [Novosphingobium profundi]|uniref:DUF2239 family protein n=1 Tax=Novosphingobium profundi TaxID=1774954 RepID=UPI001CFCE1A3|nr:DUF2239 family protein [Novosphingobium profundi]
MSTSRSSTCTAFRAGTRLAAGTRAELVRELRADPTGVLVFEDASGRVVDLDWRDTAPQEQAPPRKRGRPRLGVTAREVTLLPRHWDWLARQPGGASQALRRLVDEARRADGGRTALRTAQERCYRAMAALAGDYPGFEDAARQLFAGDMAAFGEAVAGWPEDVRTYLVALAQVREDDLA